MDDSSCTQQSFSSTGLFHIQNKTENNDKYAKKKQKVRRIQTLHFAVIFPVEKQHGIMQNCI